MKQIHGYCSDVDYFPITAFYFMNCVITAMETSVLENQTQSYSFTFDL